MEFADYLTEEDIRTDFRAPDKRAAVLALAQSLAASEPKLDVELVFRLLQEREALATTAVGSGVAIPHARVSLPDFRVVIAVSAEGVPFGAVDGEPVHIFVALLAPEGRPSAQLTMLARVSRLLKDERLRTRLLEAPDAAGAFAVLRGGTATT